MPCIEEGEIMDSPGNINPRTGKRGEMEMWGG
jgi:hypothetical protein